jgi:hypothetical protein
MNRILFKFYLQLAEKFDLDFTETSAKTGENVRLIFEGLAQSIVERKRATMIEEEATKRQNPTSGNGYTTGLNFNVTLNTAMDTIQDLYKSTANGTTNSRVNCCV